MLRAALIQPQKRARISNCSHQIEVSIWTTYTCQLSFLVSLGDRRRVDKGLYSAENSINHKLALQRAARRDREMRTVERPAKVLIAGTTSCRLQRQALPRLVLGRLD